MDLGHKDAAVLITGGASHIGRGITLSFAREGSAIALVDKDLPQAERTAADAVAAGATACTAIEADLSDHAAAAQAVAVATDTLGQVDVLVANVGWNRPGFFLDCPPEDWDHLLHVNLSATMACVRAVLPGMIERRRGAIVATTSTAAFGEPRQGVYAAAKAGVIAFIRTIAQEYGRFGIRANLVAPGLVLPQDDASLGAQSLWRDKDAVMNDAQTKYVVDRTPLRRLSQPDDIAASVLFLASDTAARQLTGQLLTVSGGFQMR
ncbi:SDR family NAD(P)-dependent oxidoreductase [Zavarzinia sp. CC-PAN008]|uniref:SDR family NAD(P)-dependent oxidoreductase n=1 Tax=Zavarzinia sp. CC-PAN008 TaxID=3243332 RepID=UPI003F747709